MTGLQDEEDGKGECCADLPQISATVLPEEYTDDGVRLRASVVDSDFSTPRRAESELQFFAEQMERMAGRGNR